MDGQPGPAQHKGGHGDGPGGTGHAAQGGHPGGELQQARHQLGSIAGGDPHQREQPGNGGEYSKVGHKLEESGKEDDKGTDVQ